MSDDRPTVAGATVSGEEIDRAARLRELGNPDEGLPRADRIINRVAESFGVALLAAVFLIVFLNAVGRYLTGMAIPWGEEVIIGVIPWLAVTGLFLSIRRRELIRITFFEERLPSRLRRGLEVLGQLLCCGLFAFIGYLAFFHVQRFGGDLTPVLSLPKGLTYSAMLVGGVAIALAFAYWAFRIVRDRGRQP